MWLFSFNSNIATLRATATSGVSGLRSLSYAAFGTGPIEVTIMWKVNIGNVVRSVIPIVVTASGNPGSCSTATETINLIVDPVPVISAVDAAFVNQSKCVVKQ